MKVVILAGGLGTRLREETEFRPKPMVEIGNRPILWHIMKIYASYGFDDFVVCLGYKGDVIRDFFLNYELRNADVTMKLGSRELKIHGQIGEAGWTVTLAETGDKTLTGGRLKRVGRFLDGQTFMVTYGDGLADIDISRLLEHHRSQGKLGTVTAVRPSSRFGELSIDQGSVTSFQEKPQIHEGWINGGFLVFEPSVLELIQGDDVSLEGGVLGKLAALGELSVYQHHGFWQCMDTYREFELLNHMWSEEKAPWAVWKHNDT